MNFSNIISVGFAIFAMLFGAGNVIYPLVLGRDFGSNVWFALAGFVVTAVFVPLIGLVATMLCDGQYKKLLGSLGRIPASLIALVCMVLIGPFALTPRTITVAHAAVKLYLPWFSIFYFSLVSGALIFCATVKQSKVIDILGTFLGPIKVGLLLIVIIKGLLNPHELLPATAPILDSFFTGLTTGYATGDLLAVIFFSGLILSGLRKGIDGALDYKKLAIMGLLSGLVGAFLIGLVYTGFCLVAAFNGAQIANVADGDIFSELSRIILGNVGGVLPNITVAISCFATAVALTVVFATYLQKEVFAGKLSYRVALITTITISTIMSNLGFSGIMKVTMPVISLIYPALLVLALVQSAHVLFGFKWIKVPVFATFAVTVVMYYWSYITPFLPAVLV
ncbi:branched-chain amino acid transport system II carrier protein [Candidatus Babeliales bacterium]|nr:branched-chain amino acid transport system II carrier protein [Candidatus Babeliales bacterium]MBY0353795.1 branched-chain amino acid transport system II carrier protein [Candidatus Babeliales bacterium]